MKKRKEYNIDYYLIMFCFYLGVFILIPYILSLFKNDISKVEYVLLLYINPIITTLVGSLRTYRHKFQPIEAIVPMIAFLPAIILFFESSAMIYVPFYGIMYLIGCAIGGYARFKESKDYKKPSLFSRLKRKR